jgi:hypothetical protein
MSIGCAMVYLTPNKSRSRIAVVELSCARLITSGQFASSPGVVELI